MIEKDLVDQFLDTVGAGWIPYRAGYVPAWYRALPDVLSVMFPMASEDGSLVLARVGVPL